MNTLNSILFSEGNHSNNLRIGIIGCGKAAEHIYVPSINKIQEIEVTSVVDPIEERRVFISKQFKGCQAFRCIEEKFFDKIDAAIICTPPDTHLALAKELLKNGKFVLLEKPLALSKDGISELIEIERNSKAPLMMAFNHRYWLPVVTFKEKLSSQIKILSAEILFEGNYSNWNPVSFQSDPLNDLGPHVFDLISFLFSKEIISITAKSVNDNNIEFKVKLEDDIIISGCVAYTKETKKIIKVITDNENFFIRLGSTRIQPPAGNVRKFLDLKDNIKRKLFRKTSPIKLSFDIQVRKFIEFVKSNKTALPGIADGVAALLAVEAAKLSIKRNSKEIFLNEI